MRSEDDFVASLVRKAPTTTGRVLVGIGDDAAVLVPPTGALVASTDTLVDGVHFELSFCRPEEVGYRAVHVAASDLAAQGAELQSVLVSLIWRSGMPRAVADAIYDGLFEACRELKADLVGGNVAQSPGPMSLTLQVLGQPFSGLSPYSLPQRRKAKLGDWIAVSGPIGEAGIGLRLLQAVGRERALREAPQLCERYLKPRCRMDVARRVLATGAVTSMMDVSDGLWLDLHRLLPTHGMDALIRGECLKPSESAQNCLSLLGINSDSWLEQIGSFGDDYELVMTLDPERWKEAVMRDLTLRDLVQLIGDISETPFEGASRFRWIQESGQTSTIPLRGWDHLSGT